MEGDERQIKTSKQLMFGMAMFVAYSVNARRDVCFVFPVQLKLCRVSSHKKSG